MKNRYETLYTGGTFDLFHAGHVSFLKKCKHLANKVVVSLNSDSFVGAYKGKDPVISYEDRECVLEACCYVDRVVKNIGNEDSKPAILSVMPDVIAVGSDWAKKDYCKQMQFTQDWLHLHQFDLVYLPYTETISSTQIKERINDKA